MIGPGGRYLWYCIPKNASRTISRMLSGVGAIRIVDVYPGLSGNDLASVGLSPSFTFAFVRNPYDRILSVWRNKVAPSEPTQNTLNIYAQHAGLHAEMPFDDFIEWLGDTHERESPNKHWAPQSEFITDGVHLLPDFIGRLEDFDRDVRKLCSFIGPVGPSRRKNEADKSDGLSAATMSQRSREIIQQIYRKDFELLGYELAVSPPPPP